MIRFGICGYGRIGQRHAAMIAQCRDAVLTAVCDPVKPETLPDGVRHCSTPESLLEAADTDVISVATPNGWHEAHAVAALRAGKHVVIEKPMALSRTSCESILHTALQAGRHVFVVMQNRYSPVSSWLRDLMDRQALGATYMVQVNCYWNRDARYYRPGSWHGTKSLDGGTLFTQFSHFIDTLYWLFGDITNLKTTLSNFNHRNLTEFEDSGIVSFEFVNGGIGSLQFSTSVWDRNFESSIVIIGERGTVKVSGQYMDRIEYCHVAETDIPQLEPYQPQLAHLAVFRNVVDVLQGKGSITTNALEGLKVVDMISRIYAAADTGGPVR